MGYFDDLGEELALTLPTFLLTLFNLYSYHLLLTDTYIIIYLLLMYYFVPGIKYKIHNGQDIFVLSLAEILAKIGQCLAHSRLSLKLLINE